MLLTQVHENHLYPFFALWFLFVALGGITNHAPTGGDAHKTETYATTDAKTEPSARNGTHITRPATRVYILASAVYFLNLFLFYGLGQGTPLGDDGGGLRMALGFDLTVPLALGNLLLFGWTVRLLLMRDGVANQGR